MSLEFHKIVFLEERDKDDTNESFAHRLEEILYDAGYMTDIVDNPEMVGAEEILYVRKLTDEELSEQMMEELGELETECSGQCENCECEEPLPDGFLEDALDELEKLEFDEE